MYTISSALSYGDPINGEVTTTSINQAIEIPHLENHFLFPMQMRMNDFKINELPKFLDENTTNGTHAVNLLQSQGGDKYPLQIHLSLHGVTSYFSVRKTTIQKYETCTRYVATYDCPDWNPHNAKFYDQ